MLLREVIGENLKAERISQDRTLRDVSATAFMSLGYLSELERGIKEVSSEMLEPICKALGITVPELLTGSHQIWNSSTGLKQVLVTYK